MRRSKIDLPSIANPSIIAPKNEDLPVQGQSTPSRQSNPTEKKCPLRRSDEHRIRSRTSSAVNVEMKPLAAAVVVATHPVHGNLTITREAKASNQNELSFKFELRGNDGKMINDSHTMYVTQSARNYRGQSAVGYNYIDLDDLQGKGIGYVYHAAASAAARELGVNLFVVDDVSTDAMRYLCAGAGMKASWNSYSLAPSLSERAFREKANSKDWTIDG